MTKTDALNQKTICRVFKIIKEYNIGLHTKENAFTMISSIQEDYYDEMIEILEGIAFDDN